MNDYKITTVGELLRELATLPPMMPIIANHRNEELYFNGISILDSGDSKTPTLVLEVYYAPESKYTVFEMNQDELEADKRHKAIEMEREKEKANKAE